MEKQDKLKAYEGSVLAQGYGVVGKRVMRDRTVKIGAKGLYCYLCVYGHEVFPKRDTICYDLGISRDTYNSYLKELVTHGYVSVRQRRGEGKKFAGNVYTINIKLSDAAGGGVEKPQRKISAAEDVPATPVIAGFVPSGNVANNTTINNTSNNQYNKTTTNRDKEKFSSADEIVNWAMRQAKEASQHFSVVVDDDVRALTDLGEQQNIDRKSILFFVGRYGKEAVKTQLGNLEFAEKRGNIDNPGGWLNCALQNGYSNLAAEKAMTKHEEALRKQEAIKRILEEEASKSVLPPDENSVFYQMYVKNIKKAEG